MGAVAGAVVNYFMSDVVNATDYYPFGMPMPGRNGLAYQSTWVPGRGFVAGNTYPDYLQIASRPYAPTPNAYRAGKEVELLPGFETLTGTDDLTVEIIAGSGVLNTDYPGGQGSYESYGYYRYGFNGKENDNEVKGAGNQQDYGMRIYDPRLGRFLSVDPLAPSYPWYSPYQFAGNKPIWMIDLDGGEEKNPSQYLYTELSVDISKMPASHKTASGSVVNTVVRPNGLKDNQAWFWDQVRTKHPEIIWSPDNVKKLDKGLVPIADETFTSQFSAFEEFAGQKIEMHHFNQTQGTGVGLPRQVHRGAGYTKMWHNFGKSLAFLGVFAGTASQAMGDPLTLNFLSKPQELEFLDESMKVGLTQNNYSAVANFAGVSNSRTNSQLPSPGIVGIYYASPEEMRSKQFPDLSKVKPGSSGFLTGGFFGDYRSASGALNKTVTHAIIYFKVNGSGGEFKPVNIIQIAPVTPQPQPKSLILNKKG